MVGITLSPEQIQSAPPDVRRWLERQIADSLGLHYPPLVAEPLSRHLVGCHVEEVRAILSQIQTVLPVVGVLFELARESFVLSPQGLRLFQLDDMVRHCRLRTTDQVLACLERINGALQDVTGNPEAAMTAVDRTGHCVVADMTARGILALWQEIAGAHALTGAALVRDERVPGLLDPVFHSPSAQAVPASAINMGQAAA